MDLRSQFLIREDITYLNFGSFGACPRSVFNRYQQYQLELEQEPVEFMITNGPKYLAQSRQALGNYIGCHPDDVVLLPNPSHAVNLVAKSFPLQPGDEVLATNIGYGACDRAWDYCCKKAGATYKQQAIQFPLRNAEHFIEQFIAGITAKTVLIFIDHITSATALRLPVEAICAIAKQKGIMVFIDGAHAPGQLPLNLQNLGVDLYTGACHKWMLTPKGSSFLYVKREHQHLFDPLVVSWGYNALFPSHSQFLDYHQMQGTRDFSAFCTLPDAIDFMRQNNWDDVSARYRGMVKEAAPELCRLLGAIPTAPITNDFILQLYSAEIKTAEPEKLHDHFYNQYRIQIPVMRQGDKTYLRYSLNAFNSQKDLETLFDAIIKIKSSTHLIEA